jgi:predicted amidophosphoribosyltransferase
MKMLRRLLEAGRLALQGDPAPATCMLCGRPLGGSTERLCPACGADLRRGGEMGRPRGEVRGYHSRQAPLRGAGRPRHDARA